MKQDSHSGERNPLKRWAALILGAALLTFGTGEWLLLQSLSSGVVRLRITLNWTAIVAFGMLLLAFAFLMVWLFDKLVTTRRLVQQANIVEMSPQRKRSSSTKFIPGAPSHAAVRKRQV